MRDAESLFVDSHAAGLTALVFLFTLINPVFAGDWKLTDSVTTRLTFVDRTGNEAESGPVAQVTPRVSLNGRGSRSSAKVDYALTASLGGSDTDPEPLTHDLSAEGEVEAIEDFFFLGAQASAKLVGDSATSGRVDSINADTDGRQTYSLSVTPVFRHRLNRYADFVSNNAIDYVDYTGGSDSTTAGEGSSSTTLNIGLQSGQALGPLSWSLGATRKNTDFDDREEKSTEANIGMGYRIDAQWSANSSIGYEDNEVQTARDNTDGVTWNVGAAWTPNPRTQASVNYGRRYIGTVYSGSLTHRTRRTNLSLDFSRDVTNRRTFQQVGSRAFVIPIIDPITNTLRLLDVVVPILGETDENFINTQLSAAMSITGRRTTVAFSGNVSTRAFEISDIDEDSYGLGVDVSRRLGGGYRASISSNYDKAEGTTNGDSETYDVRLSLNKQLSKRTSAAVEVLHRERDSTVDSEDYTENRISISLTSSFL